MAVAMFTVHVYKIGSPELQHPLHLKMTIWVQTWSEIVSNKRTMNLDLHLDGAEIPKWEPCKLRSLRSVHMKAVVSVCSSHAMWGERPSSYIIFR